MLLCVPADNKCDTTLPHYHQEDKKKRCPQNVIPALPHSSRLPSGMCDMPVPQAHQLDFAFELEVQSG